jgi:hypothetical protein
MIPARHELPLAMAARRKRRSSIVEISFVKSGGFAGPLTRVQGTVHLGDGATGHQQAQVTGDSSYQRQLAPSETEMLRAGAQPESLSKAAAAMAEQAGGPADLEQYTINVKTADGQQHQAIFHTSGANEQGVPPATAKFLAWLQQEAQKILAEKAKSK